MDLYSNTRKKRERKRGKCKTREYIQEKEGKIRKRVRKKEKEEIRDRVRKKEKEEIRDRVRKKEKE